MKYAVVVTPPGGSGYGLCSFGDATRSVYFDPLRWNATGGLPVPVASDRLTVATGWPCWLALWPLGAGTAVGVAGEAWVA